MKLHTTDIITGHTGSSMVQRFHPNRTVLGLAVLLLSWSTWTAPMVDAQLIDSVWFAQADSEAARPADLEISTTDPEPEPERAALDAETDAGVETTLDAEAGAEPVEEPVAGAGQEAAGDPEDGQPGGMPDPEDARPAEIVITGIRGMVQVRAAEDQPWVKARVGMKITQGSEFRTGPRSAVQFVINPDQTITLDRLGTMTVLQAIKRAAGSKVKTDLGLKHGRVRYKVEAAGVEHDTTIRSPRAMLAIRGSDVTHQHDVLGSYAEGQGRLEWLNRVEKQTLEFGRVVRAKISTDRPSTADLARGAATVDAKGRFVSRTEVEARVIEENPSGGGDEFLDFHDLNRRRHATSSLSTSLPPPPDVFQARMVLLSGAADLSLRAPNGFVVSAETPLDPDGQCFFTTPSPGLELVDCVRFDPGLYAVTVGLETPNGTAKLDLELRESVDGAPLDLIAPPDLIILSRDTPLVNKNITLPPP